MLFTINKTNKIIKSIEKYRFHLNNYGVLFDFCEFFEKILEFDGTMHFDKWNSMHDWVNTIDLIRWFGADAINPGIQSEMVPGPAFITKQYLVRYDDSGKIISKIPYDKDFS